MPRRRASSRRLRGDFEPAAGLDGEGVHQKLGQVARVAVVLQGVVDMDRAFVA